MQSLFTLLQVDNFRTILIHEYIMLYNYIYVTAIVRD